MPPPPTSTLLPYTTLFRSHFYPSMAIGITLLGALVADLRRRPASLVGRAYFGMAAAMVAGRSEEHTSELQSRLHLVCRLLLEKKNTTTTINRRYAIDPSIS